MDLAIRYLQKTAESFPDMTAVFDRGVKLTFRELWKKAVLLAHQIRSNGTPRVVVISIPKTKEAVVAIAAAQLAGAIYVPIDHETPPERLKHMLEKLGPHVLLKFDDGAYFLVAEKIDLLKDSKDFAEIESVLWRDLEERGCHEPLSSRRLHTRRGIGCGPFESLRAALVGH